MLSQFSAHVGDVLCLAASSDESAVWASGADPTLAHFKLTRTAVGRADDGTDGGNGGAGVDKLDAWQLSCKLTSHSHDVRALALMPAASSVESLSADGNNSNGSSGSVLLSGALDTMLYAYDAERFEPQTKARPAYPYPSAQQGSTGVVRSNADTLQAEGIAPWPDTPLLLFPQAESLQLWRLATFAPPPQVHQDYKRIPAVHSLSHPGC